jgi:hypothetical protein
MAPRRFEMSAERQKFEVDHNYDAFARILGDILPDHRDEYALMRDGEIIGFYQKAGTAYDEGTRRYADGYFSIQEVTDEPIDLGFWSHVATH